MIEVIKLFGETAIMVLKAFLSLLPTYVEFSSFKTEIIASVIGIPTIIITIIGSIKTAFILFGKISRG